MIDLGSMSKYQVKGVDQAKINAELRAEFGETVSRADLLAWREKSGIDPKWIRRNEACRVGRGLYSIPDSVGALVAPASPPGVRMAKRGRAVLETPFDDDRYDASAGVPVRAQTERKTKRSVEDEPHATQNQPDYDPSIQERAAPVYVRAWVCDDRNCVGRKPDIESVTSPTCECGSKMSRHSWAKKAR